MLRKNGFTLIEMLITVAISAILISLVYPAYETQQAGAERHRAIVALMQLAARMEVYFSDNDTYQGATVSALHGENLIDALPYQLAVTDVGNSHYTIQAIPIGSQAKRDAQCGALSLTDLNVRKISGDGDAKDCWDG